MKKTIPDIKMTEKIRLSELFQLPLGEITKARNAYLLQLHSCKKKLDRNKHKVEMKLTFEEWLSIWISSGKWYLRGKLKGQYCMCRINDIGHYEIGNVFIDLSSTNSRTAPTPIRTEESRDKVRQALIGKSRPKEVFEKGRLTKIKNGVYRPVVSETDNMFFESINAAARYYKLNASTIAARCQKNLKGFRYA